MRRSSFLVLPLFLLFLIGCGEGRESSILESSTEMGTPLTVTSAGAVFDGTSGTPGANPHFFFLDPIAENTPGYSGIADDSLEPVVTVCPFSAWDSAEEACDEGAVVARYTVDSPQSEDQVILDPGLKYSVVWRTQDYPAQAGVTYRVAVSIMEKVLGYADVTAFDNVTYSGHHNTHPDHIAISDNGSLNISFRIEDGALESEYCDASNIEDCDVALFTYEEEGCLQVFEHPGQSGELLGSQACIPAGAAKLEGAPVEGTFAVILTLEEDDTFQGGNVPVGQQIPYFPDLTTDPPGITFDAESDGVHVVICQAPEGIGSIPEALHSSLRPFIVFADGTTVLPEDYSYGAPECEGYGSHSHGIASAQGQGGVLARLAGGAVKVGKFFLPKPLVARRLHGGLNTTVYDTRGSRSESEGGAENVSAFATPGSEAVAEFGAILDVDPLNSQATVPPIGQVGAVSTITILALDGQGLPFPFEVPVVVGVQSGTDAIDAAVSYVGAGEYTATYSPTSVGSDAVTITIDGSEMGGSPYSSAIAPRSVDASGSSFEVSYSEAGSTTTVTVTVKDSQGDPYIHGENFPVDVTIEVTGANTASVAATDDDGAGNFDGTYVATYSPQNYGDDEIAVTVNGDPTQGSPFTVTTAPRPVDPGQSSATVQGSASVSGGLVDSRTDITITVLNEAGEPYDYAHVRPIDVQFSVAGANTVPPSSGSDPEGDGVYSASYTPTSAGTDYITVTIDGTAIAGSPFTSEVAPLSGDLVVEVAITGGAPEDGLPVILYPASAPQSPLTGTTDQDGKVTFLDIDFGEYTVHLPKRDFDMDFAAMTVPFTHDQAPNSVVLSATTLPLADGSRVWRIRDGGNGNAYRYFVDGRSWVASQNQIESMAPLHGASGHMVDIHSEGENTFVKDFFTLDPGLCPDETNPKKCKYKGWIGLSDENQETVFEWVTGEAPSYFNWADGNTAADQPLDRKGNLDHVEIGLTGIWGIINGASSTNEGYFVEWEVEWPETPLF